MRVLLHAHRPRGVNGAERYTTILADHLRASPRIEDVAIVFQQDDRSPPPGEWDIVHGVDLAPHRAAFARRLRLPIVMTSHVAGWQNVRQGWRTGRRNPILRVGQLGKHAAMLWKQAAALRDADAVIPCSRNTLDELAKQAPWARRKLFMVENGVDPEKFSVGTTDGGYGLFVGRMERVKQPAAVIEAFRRLGLPLRVVGRGPLSEELRANAPSNVRFEGPIDDAALVRLYQGASVVVVSSQSEGYPLVVLEALSCGAPVISTRSFMADPPARDLIRWVDYGVFAGAPAHEQTSQALLAGLEAAVRELWGSKAPENARHRHEVVAANNPWSKTADQVIDVYARVLRRATSAEAR